MYNVIHFRYTYRILFEVPVSSSHSATLNFAKNVYLSLIENVIHFKLIDYIVQIMAIISSFHLYYCFMKTLEYVYNNSNTFKYS